MQKAKRLYSKKHKNKNQKGQKQNKVVLKKFMIITYSTLFVICRTHYERGLLIGYYLFLKTCFRLANVMTFSRQQANAFSQLLLRHYIATVTTMPSSFDLRITLQQVMRRRGTANCCVRIERKIQRIRRMLFCRRNQQLVVLATKPACLIDEYNTYMLYYRRKSDLVRFLTTLVYQQTISNVPSQGHQHYSKDVSPDCPSK